MLALAAGPAVIEPHQRSMLLPVSGGSEILIDALRRLDGAGIAVDDVGIRRPTLDDVFLSLTGRVTEEVSS